LSDRHPQPCGRIVGNVVGDEYCDGAGVLGVLHLDWKDARATVDEGYLATHSQSTRGRQRLAGVGGHAHIILRDYNGAP
jgi:hypothetical protein